MNDIPNATGHRLVQISTRMACPRRSPITRRSAGKPDDLHGEDAYAVCQDTFEECDTETPPQYQWTKEFLRSQRFRISIDDSGTGYSSLKLLSEIPFTELKSDQMFVAGVPANRNLAGIVESIMHLAETLSLSTVAEGIETRTQLDFIRALDCNTGQGFYLGMPMSGFEPTNVVEDTLLALA